MNLLKTHEKSHPDYDNQIDDWTKFRNILNGGTYFIEEYLKRYSVREDNIDFANRLEMTYNPGHSEAAVMDVRNSIYQRLSDITRATDITTLNSCTVGNLRGVDNKGNTMNSFLGRTILTDLLFIGKVGVFIDRAPDAALVRSKANLNALHPYLYKVNAEDIIGWSYDAFGDLNTVLIRYDEAVIDDDTGLTTSFEDCYKLLQKTALGVSVKFYDNQMEALGQTVTLNLLHIPLVILEISKSLLSNIAGHQIALLNMESSDVNYAIKANFTFYTEQFDPKTESFARGATTDDAEDGEITDSAGTSKAVQVGAVKGRRYSVGVERPGFINPSSEPLRVSMDKEDKIIRDIRRLINLNLSTLEPTRASAESKRQDRQGLESGLAYIGMELEHGERQIAAKWAEYEGQRSPSILITYPSNYDLKTDGERDEEAASALKVATKLPSPAFRKHMLKRVAKILLQSKITQEELTIVYKEIDELPPVEADYETIAADLESGVVGVETASTLRGYVKGEAEKAKVDQAERAARVVKAQTDAAGMLPNAANRGAVDLDPDPSISKGNKS